MKKTSRVLIVITTLMALITLSFAIGVPAALGASVTCDYNASNKKVTVQATGNKVFVLLSRNRLGKINFAYLYSGLSGYQTEWCDDAATVSNTDKIVVLAGAGSQYVGLILDNGGFAPGATNEPGSSDEIEFTISLGGDSAYDSFTIRGSAADDHIRLGKSSGGFIIGKANLNGAETSGIDADVTLALGIDQFFVYAREGNDHVSGDGGKGTGEPFPVGLTIYGGQGDDTLIGTPQGDALLGDTGNDTAKGMAGPDYIYLKDAIPGNDAAFGGMGNDECLVDGGDSIQGCE